MINLEKNGIQTRSFFYPMHKQPSIKKKFPKISNNSLPVSEMLYKEGLALPIHNNLTKNNIDLICKLVCDYSK